MTDNELLAYLRDQFDEPTLTVEPWTDGLFHAFVIQDPEDCHYFNDERPHGSTPREALMDCIRVHGVMMKRERTETP